MRRWGEGEEVDRMGGGGEEERRWRGGGEEERNGEEENKIHPQDQAHSYPCRTVSELLWGYDEPLFHAAQVNLWKKKKRNKSDE